MERRSLLSNFASENGKTLTGYASVFDKPYVVSDMVDGRMKTFTEIVRPGAFRKAIETKADIVSFYNHDPNKLLGRTGSGTLRIHEDAHGLRFELDLPDSAADIRELVQRGDLNGASFSFSVRSGGERWDGNTREITDVYLYELGPVVMPASPSTSLGLRSRMSLLKLKLQACEKSQRR